MVFILSSELTRIEVNIMNRRLLDFLLVGLLLLGGVAGNAAEVPAEAVVATEATGVPMYPGAVFCIGTAETGMRFAVSDNPQTVRAWYRENLPEWSLSIYNDEDAGTSRLDPTWNIEIFVKE